MLLATGTIPALTGAGGAAAATSAGAAGRVTPAAAATSLRAWGTDNDGELGNGATGTYFDMPVTVKVPQGSRVTSVRAGCNHSGTLASPGRVLAWGDNAEGQLGNGSTTDSDIPVGVMLPPGIKVTAVSAGCYHSMALTSSGAVYTSGYNAEGQVGDGNTTDSDLPVPVSFRLACDPSPWVAGQGPCTASSSRSRIPAEQARTWLRPTAGQPSSVGQPRSMPPIIPPTAPAPADSGALLSCGR